MVKSEKTTRQDYRFWAEELKAISLGMTKSTQRRDTHLLGELSVMIDAMVIALKRQAEYGTQDLKELLDHMDPYYEKMSEEQEKEDDFLFATSELLNELGISHDLEEAEGGDIEEEF
jgi:hypothetical protein